MLRGYSALEDVPMVIPIALALILFFSSLTWAINTVNSVNRRVDTTVATIRVADAFAQWGVLTGDTWDLSCKVIRDQEKSVYFSAHLVKPDDLEDFLNSFSDRFDLKSCESVASRKPGGSSVYVRFFPVTYQELRNGVVENKVYFLVVRTWPKG